MMDFMLLFRGGNEMSRNLSPDEAQADTQRWNKWIGEIAQKGQLISGQPLLNGGKTISGKLVPCNPSNSILNSK